MRRTVGVLVAGASALLLATGSASAGGDPDNGRIAFASDRSGQFEIYSMRSDGENVRQLTNSGGNSIISDWSADGRSITFDSDRTGSVQIYVMRADGSDERQVTDLPGFSGDPAFSPDGNRIVFEHVAADCCLNIYSIRPNGSGLQQLTHFKRETFAVEPEYSPNGEWIVFGRFVPWAEKNALFLMRSDGSDLHRLTPVRLDAAHPEWSPDGGKVVFNDKFSEPVGDVYTIHADGSRLNRLTHVAGSGRAAYRPAYSPDGEKIVLNLIRPPGPNAIAVMRADGSNLHVVVPAEDDNFAPDWGARRD
jgi:TolB protein